MTFQDYLTEHLNVVGKMEATSPELALTMLVYRYQRAQETIAAANEGLDVSTSEDFQLKVEDEVDYSTLIMHAHNFYGLHGKYTDDHEGSYDTLMMHNDEGKKILITFSIYTRTVMVTVQPVA